MTPSDIDVTVHPVSAERWPDLERLFGAKGACGAKIVEGYPVEPREAGLQPDPFVWTGLASAFRETGFNEVLRRSETRPIMRRGFDCDR